MEQEKLVQPQEKDYFFSEVKKIEVMSERTQALILKILPRRPTEMTSYWICKKTKNLAREHNVEVLSYFNLAYGELKKKGLMEKVHGHHRALTYLGSLATTSDEKILSVFRPPVKKIEDELFERANSVLDDAILEDNQNFETENKRLLGIINELKKKVEKYKVHSPDIHKFANCYKILVADLKTLFPGLGYYGCNTYGKAAIKKLEEYKAATRKLEEHKAAEEDLAKQLLVVSELRNALTIAFREYNRDLPVNGAKL